MDERRAERVEGLRGIPASRRLGTRSTAPDAEGQSPIEEEAESRSREQAARAYAEAEPDGPWPGVQARHVMSQPVTTVGEAEPAAGAMGRMREAGIHHLPVLSDRGNVVGMLTEWGLARAGLHLEPDIGTGNERERATRASAGDLMAEPAPSVHPEAGVSAVARQMLDEGAEAVTVRTEEEGLVGIITQSDLLRVLADHRAFEGQA